MEGPLQERDWKYMRSIENELLQELCSRINRQSAQILDDAEKTQHERYGELYSHIKDSDRIIGDCFNDWSRSRLDMKIIFLRRHNLLTDEHVEGLSDSAQEWMKKMDEFPL